MGLLLGLASHPERSFEQWPLSENQKKSVLKGVFYVQSKVDSTGENDNATQKLNYKIAGLHPKSCSIALRRLTLYENYHQILGFVEQSQYDEKEERISLVLGHTLLPFRMGLQFKIPRMKGPGRFPLTFDRGFLMGLVGQIEISEHLGRCAFYAEAAWEGPTTGIPDSVFSLFSTTLSRMAMESLFRASLNP